MIRLRAKIAGEWHYYRAENVAGGAALIAVLKLSGIQCELLGEG